MANRGNRANGLTQVILRASWAAHRNHWRARDSVTQSTAATAHKLSSHSPINPSQFPFVVPVRNFDRKTECPRSNNPSCSHVRAKRCRRVAGLSYNSLSGTGASDSEATWCQFVGHLNRIREFLSSLFRLASPSDSLSKVVIRGHTGREIAVDHDFYRAQRLALRPRFLLRFSPWAWRIARHLRDGPVAAPSILVLLRARPDDNSIHGWEQMGPPPVGRAPAGRL